MLAPDEKGGSGFLVRSGEAVLGTSWAATVSTFSPTGAVVAGESEIVPVAPNMTSRAACSEIGTLLSKLVAVGL